MNTTTPGDRGDSHLSNRSTAASDPESTLLRLQSKIAYIESQIDALPGFLPDSYHYLMQQLDQHQHQLLSLLLKDQFAAIDATD